MKSRFDWRSFLLQLDASLELGPPASAASLRGIESSLGLELPGSMRELLSQADGVGGPGKRGLVWPAERILQENLAFRANPEFRDLYMPFDPLLFIGDAGDGDQFAFRICNRRTPLAEVYVWNHENDSRVWLATSLRSYLEGAIAERY